MMDCWRMVFFEMDFVWTGFWKVDSWRMDLWRPLEVGFLEDGFLEGGFWEDVFLENGFWKSLEVGFLEEGLLEGGCLEDFSRRATRCPRAARGRARGARAAGRAIPASGPRPRGQGEEGEGGEGGATAILGLKMPARTVGEAIPHRPRPGAPRPPARPPPAHLRARSRSRTPRVVIPRQARRAQRTWGSPLGWPDVAASPRPTPRHPGTPPWAPTMASEQEFELHLRGSWPPNARMRGFSPFCLPPLGWMGGWPVRGPMDEERVRRAWAVGLPGPTE